MSIRLVEQCEYTRPDDLEGDERVVALAPAFDHQVSFERPAHLPLEPIEPMRMVSSADDLLPVVQFEFETVRSELFAHG
jgi:hypothetical protein